MQKYDLKDVKDMHYLDYKLNNTPSGMKKYSGKNYPRLVEFLYQQGHKSDRQPVKKTDKKRALKRIYRILWREGLFRSCQA